MDEVTGTHSVLEPAIHAARAIRRGEHAPHPGEEDPANTEAFDHALMKAVGAPPLHVVRNFAEHGTQAIVDGDRDRYAELHLSTGDDGVRWQLDVDSPDIIRLRVNDHLAPAVERGIQMGVTFGRQWQLCPHIGDQEDILMRLADQSQPSFLSRASVPSGAHGR